MSSSTSQNKNGYIGRKIYPLVDISLIKIFNKRYIYKRIYPWRDISAKDILILDIFLNEYFRLKYLFFPKRDISLVIYGVSLIYLFWIYP